MSWEIQEPSRQTLRKALETKAAIPIMKDWLKQRDLQEKKEKAPEAKQGKGSWRGRHKVRTKRLDDEEYFNSEDLKSLTPTGRAFEGSALDLHYILTPNFKLYDWQAEELLRLSGGAAGYEFNDQAPCKYVMVAANGSGKDEIVIARFSVWLAMAYFKSRVIVTTSSQTQLFNQTRPHLQSYISTLQRALKQDVHSTKLHHFIENTGSEILMFVTNEPGRAEGYHPWGAGKMALIVNEGKSVSEAIYSSIYRCTGYSHFLQTSSPGPKRGQFYLSYKDSDKYPKGLRPGHWFSRQIKADDCPHIAESHQKDMRRRMSATWIASSLDAKFVDEEDFEVVVPTDKWNDLLRTRVMHRGNKIGIGLDIGKGVASTVCYVRQGNKVINHLAFIEKNTIKQADKLGRFLAPYRETGRPYVFAADDNGYGSAVIDLLESRGWRIRRTTNQAAAVNKKKYLNFGAESYFHVLYLVEHKLIDPSTYETSILSRQLTARRATVSGLGKRRLEPKETVLANGGESPDYADALVLCYCTFRSKLARPTNGSESTLDQNFIENYGWNDRRNTKPTGVRTFIGLG